MGEQMDHRWEQQEQTFLRHHLAMLKCSRDDQELVTGSGTHLGGVVVKARDKVKHTNVSEKVTVDVLSRRILEYGLVKAERAINLVWHCFRKFCPKEIVAKRPDIDPLRVQGHVLCMLCYESTE